MVNTLTRLIRHTRKRVSRFADAFGRRVFDRFRVRSRARRRSSPETEAR